MTDLQNAREDSRPFGLEKNPDACFFILFENERAVDDFKGTLGLDGIGAFAVLHASS